MAIMENHMKQFSLSEYVDLYGQTKTAVDLGVYQSAISKAINTGRKVTVTIDEEGKIKGEETRPFPSIKKQAA